MNREALEKEIKEIDNRLHTINSEGTDLLAKKYKLMQQLRNEPTKEQESRSLVVKSVFEDYEYWYQGKKIEPTFKKIKVIYPFSKEQVYDVVWKKNLIIHTSMEQEACTLRTEGFYTIDLNGDKIEMKLNEGRSDLIIIPIMEE